MKATKIVYWITTIIISVMMTYSAYLYLTEESLQQAFYHLGFPDYFRVQLAVAKVIGAILLLVPLGSSLKEWVYLGFAITFISACIAHIAVKDPISYVIGPIIFLVLLVVSYITYKRLHNPARSGISVHHPV